MGVKETSRLLFGIRSEETKMTPNELLKQKPLDIFKSDGFNNEEVFALIKAGDADHLPEVDISGFLWTETLAGMDNRLMVKVYSDMPRIMVVYYTHIPVMITAGGNSLARRWILNDVQFTHMVDHLQGLFDSIAPKQYTPVDLDKNIPELMINNE